jgi:uncharacterized radical SAM protein YgiQ
MAKAQFLPMSLEEAEKFGWSELDVIIVTGDAYIDHPSFGAAVIGRVLEAEGFRVGIIAQPKWRTLDDFKKLSKPRLFFGVTAGNIDSMVNHYTASKKPRRDDAYSPGNKVGLRPDRATIVYSNKIREAFKDIPIVLGGIEASLRRFAHYDYWSDTVRQSILADSPADLLVYGMGEKQVVEIARNIAMGKDIKNIKNIKGTVYKAREISDLKNYIEVPSFEEVSSSKLKYAEAFKIIYKQQDPYLGKTLVQRHPKCYIVQNKPAAPLSTQELDRIYELPYQRKAHPIYKLKIKALESVKFSIVSHRGCFGDCSFCALAMHQGKIVQSRSVESIVREVKSLTKHRDFKGIIQDVGGPTANMYGLGCKLKSYCKEKACLYPEPCEKLNFDHELQIKLLRRLRKIKGVKKVFIGSGVRYDLALLDPRYLQEICKYHISGQLRVAPEHVSKEVLDAMRKPNRGLYERFRKQFEAINRQIGKEQYLAPYFMSSHPGCTLKHMIELAEYIRDMGFFVEQVQDFTPTPMTASTTMYYTELNPFSNEKIYVPKSERERKIQRALLQFQSQENYYFVKLALKEVGREDLIGEGPKCLIPKRRKIHVELEREEVAWDSSGVNL